MGIKMKKFRGERVVAIVQARYASNNLPGTALALIDGETVLGHILKRIKRVKAIKDIVVATTPDPRDEDIVKEAARYKVPSIIGHDSDVLARFRTAARIMRASVVTRLKADSPLISPEMMTRIINYRKKHQYDYVAMHGLPQGAGAEVITVRTLVTLDRLTTLQRHREAVTLYLLENIDEFRVKFMNAPVNVNRPRYKLSIDSLEELELVRVILQHFRDKKFQYSLQHIVKFLDKHPEYMAQIQRMEMEAA